MAEPVVLEDAWINTNQDREKWIRVDPESGGLYRYNSGNGQYDIPLPISLPSITGLEDALAGKSATSHQHATHGDINFTGSISAGGEAGIDSSGEGEYEVGQIESIKVRKGVIVGFTEK